MAAGRRPLRLAALLLLSLLRAASLAQEQPGLCESLDADGKKAALLAVANPFFGPAAAAMPREGGRRDLAVLMTLYSPGRFVRPVLNALAVKNRIEAAGVPLYVVEVAVGKEEHVFPPGPNTLLLRSDSCLFQKERLLNVLLQKKVARRFTKLLFLDADVGLASHQPDGPHWYDVLSDLLDSNDVVHPFDVCGYLDLAMRRVDEVKCSVLHATRTRPLDPQLSTLHPGFGWAYRRDWLTRMGGLFDLAIHGGGDSLNGAAVGRFDVCWPDASPPPDGFKHCKLAFNGLLVQAYAEQFGKYALAARADPPRVSVAPLLAVHYWHGRKQKRQISRRFDHFQNISRIMDVLESSPDGIWELRTRESALAADLNATLCRYFKHRSDDDVT